jgi:methionyl-tRNA formyltransferase
VKALFFGTPEVAAPFLDALARKAEVCAVVSQPDKPAGRGLSVEATPVKRAAERLGLQVLQPAKPSEIAGKLAAFGADVGVVVAYGRILKKDVLASAKHGLLNVHFSLLPKYRGAAPVQWTLVRGEARTGVTLFWLDEGMDTGPIFLQKEAEIGPDEDAAALMERLVALGVAALDEALDRIEAGRVEAKPQIGASSAAPLIKKEDALMDLARPAQELHDLVRGFRVWPKAYLTLKTGRLLVLRSKVGAAGDGPVGKVESVDPSGGILIQCGLRSRLWFLTVQPEGKKPVTAADYLNGLRLKAGDFLPL